MTEFDKTETAGVSIVGPDGGEAIQLGPIRMRILEDGTTTRHRLGLGEITLPPHVSGPPQHRHAEHDEGFYVLSGTPRFTVGTEEYDTPAGTLVMVPPGAPHTFANPADVPAVILNTFTPDLYVQYFRDMQATLSSGPTVEPDDIADVMRRYATEPATDFGPVGGGSGPDDGLAGAQEGGLAARPEADMAGASTHELTLAGLPLTVTELGDGQPVLLLHGGGGPQSLGGFGPLLAARLPARVITPIHPGFGGTPRPDSLATIGGLAAVYRDLLDELDLHDVTVIGNSIGGWIAAELALLHSPRVARVVLCDPAGIAVAGHPVVDIFPLALDELARLSYHNPAAFRVDPAAMTDAQRSIVAANRAALQIYGGQPSMSDPGLLGRLSQISSPTLVVWGQSDQIVDPDYGRAFAAAIPGAQFLVLPETGHLPQLESPELLFAAVREFAGPPAAA
jgi:pimeloyl-ACP methyl ester carboxylesterase/mannose-6-phosphate isomerase-like protein (cupin superfamily)